LLLLIFPVVGKEEEEGAENLVTPRKVAVVWLPQLLLLLLLLLSSASWAAESRGRGRTPEERQGNLLLTTSSPVGCERRSSLRKNTVI